MEYRKRITRDYHKTLTHELPHELSSCLNNLGLMILINEFYLAVLKDYLLDISLI